MSARFRLTDIPPDISAAPLAEIASAADTCTDKRPDIDSADDILSMTDEEILAEIAADGEDPKQIAQEAKDIFERAIATCKKSRLAAAKDSPELEHRNLKNTHVRVTAKSGVKP